MSAADRPTRGRLRPCLPALAALLLALAAASGGGCVLFVDDPDGWTVAKGGEGGEGGAGGSGQGGAGQGGQGGTPSLRCQGDELSCFCQQGSGGKKSCSSTSLDGNALCCAEAGWPTKPGTSCSCRLLRCDDAFSGCSCALGQEYGPYSSCSGSVCCQSGDYCKCGGSSCFSGDEVDSCSALDLECASGEVKVGSCGP